MNMEGGCHGSFKGLILASALPGESKENYKNLSQDIET
jgi:hypothetical protein